MAVVSLFFLSGIALVFTMPLAARGSGMLVLPFQVQGDPARAGFASRTGIPDRLQEASHFLLHTARDGNLISVAAARAAASRAEWRTGQKLDRSRAGRLCSEARADYLLAGSASFLPGGKILLSATTHICRTGQSVTGARESTSGRNFQRTLRRVLVRATPFWQPRVSPGIPAAGGAVDLAVVLDHSGSMIEDLPLILRALDAVHSALPAGSRLGIVTVGGGDRLDVIPFTDQWQSALATAREKSAGGEVSLAGIERALGIVHSYREWKGSRKLMLFSDARIGKRRSGLEGYLRRLKSAGSDVRLFCLLNQQYEDRAEWRRMARSLELADPAVIYGREAGFIDQPSQFLLMDGPRFFLSRRDLRSSILRGEAPADVLQPVETIHFERSELNLTDLPGALARKNGTRLAYLGPIVSGLEVSIAAGAAAGASGQHDPGAARVLVKNAGLSFWIQVADRGILAQMRRSIGETMYVGLHLSPAPGAGEKLVNLSKPVYIRNQGEVPRLFINTWPALAKRSERDLVRDDVHFLLLRILEIDDGRSTQDIRR